MEKELISPPPVAPIHHTETNLHGVTLADNYAWLRDQGRARYLAITDQQALDAFERTAKLEGIIPALESSHAIAWALANPDSELDLICLSGRGDKDLAEALEGLRARA